MLLHGGGGVLAEGVLAGRGGEVEVFGWLGQLEHVQDGFLCAGGGRALGDAAVGGGQGDLVHAVEFVAEVAPGVAGGGLGDADEQQGEPSTTRRLGNHGSTSCGRSTALVTACMPAGEGP